ncbi:dynactin subunit p22 domain-containing protein [Hirsutella rhossiliensis]|uniref:Dynactin subunit p22 domain-containing protein n=1 Tax=Hirsutella rhossiliensis TaxID=111463 RepID=A0A9P8SJM4_9HYPO|nr:dynactin subunit p22 domain-containing protein [Hirsutella rhossiliensis]KAH0963875.1 dynactin subunit p22 domain-containing protein [Hirsutella rhossiliensis]
MDNPLDQTTLSTISLLESRLLRLEHVLYGPTASHPPAQPESVSWRMGQLEKRFSVMLSRIRVYGDLLKIYRSHPDLFHAPASSEPPSQLSADAIRSMVLASASSYPAILSSLTAIKDSPIPDVSESTALISMTDRMKAIQVTQAAQAADMAELRRRSEVVVRSWYESNLLAGSRSMADMESRVEGVERQVRRRERAKEEDKEM